MDDVDISRGSYEEIETAIESDETPVGIDAKKAHVIIIHKLIELERRLDRLEERLAD